MAEQERVGGMGVVGGIGVLIGLGTALVGLLAVPNTAFDLGLALRVGGTRTALPDTWEATAGVLGAGFAIAGLSWFGSYAWRRAARSRSVAGKVGVAAAALGLLAIAGFGAQRLAIVMTYGSLLAYYATFPDPGPVRDALRPGTDVEVLDAAVMRAAQYDNAEVLAVLLEGGADLRQSSRPPERRLCPLAGTSLAFVEVALAHGAAPATTPCDDLMEELFRFGGDGDETAAIAARLRTAGW